MHYSPDVPVLICGDSRFADQKAYQVFEQVLYIYFIKTGKFNDDVKKYIEHLPNDSFGEIAKGKIIWHFTEFGNKLKS